MCEWLSRGEWCDVKLMCGGRAFSAHRAVLASVSTFLRRILLSCPIDETPTFIVLPDFDFEAMSSVLYYIYNGEVVVQKEKLEMFLEIMNAMQIFIDSQYLPKKHDTADFIKSNAGAECVNTFCKRNIFTLGLQDLKDQRYIKLKKGKEIQDELLQYSLENTDCSDKLVRCQNPSGERNSALGNLKSPFGDRQRNSFLRDLFIETYPRNGNVNGLPAGVLAISNECYRAPASVLLTNANAKHLGAVDTLLQPHKKTGEHISHSSTVFHPRKQKCKRDEHDYGETSKGLHPSYLNCCQTELQNNTQQYENNEIKTRSKHIWSQKPESLHQVKLKDHVISEFYVPSIGLNVNPPMIGTMRAYQTYSHIRSTSQFLVSGTHVENNKELTLNGASRTAIFNQVLENPWSPRIPINYKPYRRKINNLQEPQLPQILEQKCNFDGILNDNNNNVSDNPDEEGVEAVESSVVKETTISSHAVTNRTDDFKCTICNQVFTNGESLSAHMRRHNSIARYTCGECGKTFSQLRNFKYHMSIHRGTREFAATCTECGKYFNDRGYLSSHMKIHRNRKEYKCTMCPKSFNQRVAYNMHVRIHTGVKPHVCEECGKAFSRKMLLKQHQRTHSGERPYACPHCDKRFADRSNMTLHLRLHTGVKPFSCTLCPKSFTKKHHLKSHLNFHTGSKPYSCPRCNLAFTQSSNMRTHFKKCSAPAELNSESENSKNT